MKRFVLGTIATAAIAISSNAMAAGERILVAGPADHELTAAVQRELVAMGFETVRGDEASHCSSATVAELAKAQQAVAATCTRGNTVVVWTVDGDFVRLEDILYANAEDSTQGFQSISVRVAEVARASIGVAGDREEQPAMLTSAQLEIPASVETEARAAESPRNVDVEPIEELPPKAINADRTPMAMASFGVGALVGSGTDVTTIDSALRIRVGRRLHPFVRCAVPITKENAITANATGETRTGLMPGLAALGVDVPFLSLLDRFEARIGLATGVAWVGADSVLAMQLAESSPRRSYVLGGAGLANLSAATRVYGPIGIVLDGTAGTTFSELVVATDGQVITRWQAFGAAAMRVELAVK